MGAISQIVETGLLLGAVSHGWPQWTRGEHIEATVLENLAKIVASAGGEAKRWLAAPTFTRLTVRKEHCKAVECEACKP